RRTTAWRVSCQPVVDARLGETTPSSPSGDGRRGAAVVLASSRTLSHPGDQETQSSARNLGGLIRVNVVMVSQQTYFYWLAVWVVCAGVSLWTQRRPGSGAGLTISYVLQLWILHWLAAAIYAFPWYQAADIDTVLGLQQSTYAIAGFTVGVALV